MDTINTDYIMDTFSISFSTGERETRERGREGGAGRGREYMRVWWKGGNSGDGLETARR